MTYRHKMPKYFPNFPAFSSQKNGPGPDTRGWSFPARCKAMHLRTVRGSVRRIAREMPAISKNPLRSIKIRRLRKIPPGIRKNRAPGGVLCWQRGRACGTIRRYIEKMGPDAPFQSAVMIPAFPRNYKWARAKTNNRAERVKIPGERFPRKSTEKMRKERREY